jgi:hypothetical protein
MSLFYNWLAKKSDQIVMAEGIEKTPNIDDFDKNENHLIVFDDLVLTKDQRIIEIGYLITCIHYCHCLRM